MRLLLDTHVLLWWLDNPNLIAEPARDAVADPDNSVLVSTVSVWEIAIKRGLGKLTAPGDLEAAITDCGFQELQISTAHALFTETLPFHHRDPFDRMLVAQTLVENCHLVTHDALIEQYGVPTLRA